MLWVTLTLALAASSFSPSAADREILEPISEATTSIVAASASVATSPPPHSIKERSAVIPLPEDEGDEAAVEDEGVQGDEADSTGRRAERDCYRAAEIFSRRSALDKNFMRFGRSDEKASNRRDSDDFARFGRNRNFIRFGRSGPGGLSPGNNFIRLGRSEGGDGADEGTEERSTRGSANNFVRFGRESDAASGRGEADSEGDIARFSRNLPDRNFMRFGRSSTSDLVRNGRTQQQTANLDRNFMRLGRSRSDEDLNRVYRASLDRNFMRFGRSNDRNFIRFGRGSGNNFMRFGRNGEGEAVDVKEPTIGAEKSGDLTSEAQSRSKRSTEEDLATSSMDAVFPEDRDSVPASSSAFLVFPELVSLSDRGADGERERRGRSNFIRFG